MGNAARMNLAYIISSNSCPDKLVGFQCCKTSSVLSLLSSLTQHNQIFQDTGTLGWETQGSKRQRKLQAWKLIHGVAKSREDKNSLLLSGISFQLFLWAPPAPSVQKAWCLGTKPHFVQLKTPALISCNAAIPHHQLFVIMCYHNNKYILMFYSSNTEQRLGPHCIRPLAEAL